MILPNLPPHSLACALLLHTPPAGGAQGAHFDLLIDPPIPFPPPNAGRLWTARVDIPPEEWAQTKTFPLTVTFPHRREYLTYEGPVSGNRGEVKRVNEGFAEAVVWEADRMELNLALRGFNGRLNLRRVDGDAWEGQVK